MLQGEGRTSSETEIEAQKAGTAQQGVKRPREQTSDQANAEVQAKRLCDQRGEQSNAQDGAAKKQPAVPRPSSANCDLPDSSDLGSCIVGHKHIQVTSLKDIQTHAVPYKFRVRVRIMDFSPKCTVANDFIRVFCPRCEFLSILPDCPSTILNEDSWAASAEPDYMERTRLGNLPRYKCPQCSKGGKHKAQDSRVLHYIYLLKVFFFTY